MATLRIRELSVEVPGKEIIRSLSLTIRDGELHALMGPNGSGKSTLALALAGHPALSVHGSVSLDSKDLLKMKPEERARAGLFLAFQYPLAVPGLPLAQFLNTAIQAKSNKNSNFKNFVIQLRKTLSSHGLPLDFASRPLNEGTSGGEKKRLEILQLEMLAPRFAVLDEFDSGLDVDALRTVSEAIKRLHEAHRMGILLITHYDRALRYLAPDFVHVMLNGRIVAHGGRELARKVEREGYKPWETV